MRASEAAKKTCPLSLCSSDPVLCLETRCMSWAWLGMEHRYYFVPVGLRPRGLGWGLWGARDGVNVWRKLLSDSEREGFCRIAQAGHELCSCKDNGTRRLHLLEAAELETAETGHGSELHRSPEAL